MVLYVGTRDIKLKCKGSREASIEVYSSRAHIHTLGHTHIPLKMFASKYSDFFTSSLITMENSFIKILSNLTVIYQFYFIYPTLE